MTWHHVAALLIAAALFLACELSGVCSEKMIDKASELALAIAVGTFGHAGAGLRRKTEAGSDGK